MQTWRATRYSITSWNDHDSRPVPCLLNRQWPYASSAPPLPSRFRVGQFPQIASTDSHMYERLGPILLNEAMVFTTAYSLSVPVTLWTLCGSNNAQDSSGEMTERKEWDELFALWRNVSSRPRRRDGRISLWLGGHRWSLLSLRRGRKFDARVFAARAE